MTNEVLNDPELNRILLACLDCGKEKPEPVIWFSSVARYYKARYGRTFHQSRLAELERLGVLAKDGDTSRGGSRRYYRIIDPFALAELLKGYNAN
jgi:hypothetical protein